MLMTILHIIPLMFIHRLSMINLGCRGLALCEAKDEGISDGAGPVYAAAMTLEFQQPPYKVVPPQFIS